MNLLPLCGCPAMPGNHVHLPKLTVQPFGEVIAAGPPRAGCHRCGTEMNWPISDKTCPGCLVFHPKAKP